MIVSYIQQNSTTKIKCFRMHHHKLRARPNRQIQRQERQKQQHMNARKLTF